MHRFPTVGLALLVAVASSAMAQDEAPIVAKVNDTTFTRSDLEASYNELPEQYRQLPLEMLYEPLLDRLIDGQLLLEKAEAENFAARPEVEAAIARARADVLRQTLIEQTVEQATDDATLQAAYEARRADPGFVIEEVHARHILVETEDEAKALIVELDGGADFAALAGEHSSDGSAARGGDLGTFRRGMMVPPFEEAAFALEPGTHSAEPVQTQFGWHVILVEERATIEPSFAELEDELRNELVRAAIDDLLAGVRDGAVIERFGPDGSPRE